MLALSAPLSDDDFKVLTSGKDFKQYFVAQDNDGNAVIIGIEDTYDGHAHERAFVHIAPVSNLTGVFHCAQ